MAERARGGAAGLTLGHDSKNLQSKVGSGSGEMLAREIAAETGFVAARRSQRVEAILMLGTGPEAACDQSQDRALR